MRADAKNLEAISRAIDQHNASCPWPASEIRMNPFEVERLGWDQVRGLPVTGDPSVGTGRFVVVCSRDGDSGGVESEEEAVDAIGAAIGGGPTGPEGPQTSFQKFSPRSSSQPWTSTFRRKSSPVQTRTPMMIRIAPPMPMMIP